MYLTAMGIIDLTKCNYHDVKNEWSISEPQANASLLFLKIPGGRRDPPSDTCATAGGNPGKSSDYVNMFTCKFLPEELWRIVKIRD